LRGIFSTTFILVEFLFFIIFFDIAIFRVGIGKNKGGILKIKKIEINKNIVKLKDIDILINSINIKKRFIKIRFKYF
jgi:hypothetical protein